jgi:amino acid transporter
VFVCTLAIQGATTRLMFSMGRDRRMPFGSVWAHVSPTYRTPANAAVAVGVLAAIPIILTGALGAAILAIAATGTIYLSYFLCNIGVLMARRRGWPQRSAPFSLRGWGTVINVAALVWGGLMLVNFALWQAQDVLGDFGSDAMRALTNPRINDFLSFGTTADGAPNTLTWLPPVPVFEAIVALVFVVGAIYYYAVARTAVEPVLEADLATGEATIG